MQDSVEPRRLKRSKQLLIDTAIVVGASLIVSLPFCNKAFHIDDPYYLSIARQILVNPLEPFHGLINWQQIAVPAWNESISPPGYSYWLAAWMALGITGEVGLHLAGSFWTVVLGLATYAWARRLGQWPVAAALLVVTGTLVAAGQNLMLDVPMLALAASSIVLYLRASDKNSVGWATAAGVLAGLAVNFKYAGIVAIGIVSVDALIWRRWRMLTAPLVAIVLLGAGQLASVIVYGTPHLIHARGWITQLFPTDWHETLHRTASSVVYLGSSAAWLVLLAGRNYHRGPWQFAVMSGVVAAGVGATVLDLWHREPLVSAVPILQAGLFACNGWLVLGWLGVTLFNRRADSWDAQRLRHLLPLLLWFAGFWYLGVLNGPFVAPRALLPCALSLTLMLLALAPATSSPTLTRSVSEGAAECQPHSRVGLVSPLAAGDWSAVRQVAAFLLTLVAGLLVGFADQQWAEVYRGWAPRLVLHYRPQSGRLYFLGHWGWQHYAEAAGMVQFDPSRTRLASGDVLVLPQNVDCPLPLELVLRGCQQIAREEVAGSSWLPRTRDPEGLIFLYGDTARGRIPWGWSAPGHPQEVFLIFRYGG